MKPRDRIEYRPATEPDSKKLPGGLRVIVWPLIVLEEWDVDRPMPRQAVPQPLGKSLLPDVMNWTWHEYGMRVGFWRLKQIFDDLRLAASVPINAQVFDHYPKIAEACVKENWCFLGHGTRQVPLHYDENSLETIQGSFDRIKSFTGQTPNGWLAPGLAQTLETPDQLVQVGFKYMGDWVLDDVPVWVKAGESEIAALPYNVEVNDIPLINVGHAEASYIRRRALATHAQLMAEARRHNQVKFMSFAMHPFLSGSPERAAEIQHTLRVLAECSETGIWNADQIYDWFSNE